MKDKEFQNFSSFIFDHVGIKLPPAKKTMLEARLQKRLKALNIATFEAYSDLVFSPEGQSTELIHFIDVVTTNKTDFFREPAHFDYLTKTALPAILQKRGGYLREPVRIWSAGCSSGEEPYTLAMVMSEFADDRQDFRFSILASDISTRILDKAKKAVYPEESTSTISAILKKKYLLRSKDRNSSLVRICPALRSQIVFKRINFMDDDFGFSDKMDIIFCRNVVIYFDKPTQQALMRKFHRQLRTDGYLFLGHSETLNGLDVDFRAVSSTVYRKT
ncbi:MAG: protein-glutamate O-methyltransferase CheR [Deltaproteobacteria bacterium]|nr:protein-glutamate O-methyltransferase CheR [Deltaproteobacteria bacterium]